MALISLHSSYISCLTKPIIAFFICIIGSQSRSYTSPRVNGGIGPSYRQGGFPKFPIMSPEVTLSTCGISRTPKVVGGRAASYGDHPWQVELEVYKRNEGFVHRCGGAIISPFHLLTAAHCLHEQQKSDFRVKVGDHNLELKDEDEQMFSVESWRVHPNFKIGGAYNNDIAVVKISPQRGEGIKMSRSVTPVCLPSALTSSTDATNCKVTGWGLTEPGNDYSHATVLQSANVPLISDKKCKELHGKDFGPGMVCAGHLAGKIDACSGDSGGPLVCEINGVGTLFGVVSWGIECAEPKFPGVYSSTQYHLDWIKKALDEL